MRAAQRLTVLWVALGTIELVIHDVGNERRFVFFIPALIAIAATTLAGRREGAPAELAAVPRARALLAAPVILFAMYVMAGGIARVFFLYEIRPAVRIAAACAVAATIALYLTWPWVPRWLARQRWSLRAAYAAVLLVCAGDLAQFAQWAGGPDLQELRSLAGNRPGAAAGHAGARQARKRAVAREPHPSRVRGPWVRQLRRPEAAG